MFQLFSCVAWVNNSADTCLAIWFKAVIVLCLSLSPSLPLSPTHSVTFGFFTLWPNYSTCLSGRRSCIKVKMAYSARKFERRKRERSKRKKERDDWNKWYKYLEPKTRWKRKWRHEKRKPSGSLKDHSCIHSFCTWSCFSSSLVSELSLSHTNTFFCKAEWRGFILHPVLHA